MKRNVEFFSLVMIFGFGFFNAINASASNAPAADIYSESFYKDSKIELPESLESSEIKAASEELLTAEKSQTPENTNNRKKLRAKNSNKNSASN